MTSIEWTDATWNPTVGCSRVSAGCQRCYAEKVAHRGMSPQHRGLTVFGAAGVRWTGEVRLVESALAKPLGWKKPRRVFVNSMSDLFHEGLSNETIARVFGVMAACPQHTFQVLTKRASRLPEWFRWIADQGQILLEQVGEDPPSGTPIPSACAMFNTTGFMDGAPFLAATRAKWPLPNVWLGVSVENQATADERIPLLLETPAAVRFVSYEPALGPVRLDRLTDDEGLWYNALRGRFSGNDGADGPRLDWVIVGGESGAGARPFDVAWARSTVQACKAAGVACFVKQLGAKPVDSTPRPGHCADGLTRVRLRDRKGGDTSEWPPDLRVREFPEVR